MMNNAQ